MHVYVNIYDTYIKLHEYTHCLSYANSHTHTNTHTPTHKPYTCTCANTYTQTHKQTHTSVRVHSLSLSHGVSFRFTTYRPGESIARHQQAYPK